MRESKIKGQSFLSLSRAIETLRGGDVKARAVELLEPEFAHALTLGGIIASGWYPCAWYCELHDAAQRATAEGPDLALELGRETARRDVGTIYRLLFKFVSPGTLLENSQRLLRTFVDRGDVKILEKSATSARARYVIPGADGNVYRDFFAGAAYALELSGARDVRTRIVAGAGDGDGFMEVEATWR